MARTIPERESLTVEFKSDARRLPDAELVAAVVCLANTDGGEIYLGVEDDGTVTGLHREHLNVTGLTALIANRSNPPISVRVTQFEESGITIARIEVPKSQQLVATSEGLLQRRRLQADGRPQCMPFYPHEFASRQSDLRLVDYSALPVAGASVEDFDPLERERLRQIVERYGGERILLALSDEEVEGALGLIQREGDRRVPTVTGLLLLGRESAVRQHLPTHEVAFQELRGTDVRANDFYRWPLLKTFERVMDQLTARIDEDELQFGLFRVPVPRYDSRAFREALINALVHRDYTRLGAVHARMEQGQLVISNPGGFVDGVSPENILVTEPRPRNPLLADAVKRIGLAERTGRGVDLIYQGLLRYGRPAPDYGRSDRYSVVVVLSGADANLRLLRLVLEEETRLGRPLPVDTLLALGLLYRQRRITASELAHAMQRDDTAARMVLEQLVEADLAEAHGIKSGRTYTLSSRVYRETGDPAGYVRQVGFAPLQQEQMVLRYVTEHGRITRGDVMELCKISEDQATRLLDRLTNRGLLARRGSGRGTHYVSAKTAN